MPGDNLTSRTIGGVGNFDNKIIIPQVPDHAPAGEGAGKDVLHLSVPRYTPHIIHRLAFGARSHKSAQLVDIPDNTARTPYHHWPGGSIEKVEVQSGDRSSVLVLLLDQLGSIVHRDYTPVSPLLLIPLVWYPLPSRKRPMNFVESLLHMKRCQTWHVMP